jgi:uncharacterized protein (TIGR02217 family)
MTVRAIEFPRCISIEGSGGPKFLTTINETASGFEFRNADWSRQRCEFDVASGIKSGDDARQIRNLFYASLGRAYGFLYYDWNDHRIGTEDAPQLLGSGTTLQLFKRYQFGSYVFDRVITRPNLAAQVDLYIGGVLADPGDYEIDDTTGEINIGESATVSIYVEEFFVPVRFDHDDLHEVLKFIDRYGDEDVPVFEIPTIRLVEIKEEGYVPGET